MSMKTSQQVDWKEIKAVIFDLDGTLYEQSRLRKKMLSVLIMHYGLRPWRFKELKTLYHFRNEREERPGYSSDNLENEQYHWCAEKAKMKPEQIRLLVEKWMFNIPNRYLAKCVFPGTRELIYLLKRVGLKTAVYSDYKAHDKLRAMGIEVDMVISSTDACVNRLKPDPKAPLLIAEKFGLSPEECLFIGDREELDGQCAQNAGMPYLILDKESGKKKLDTFRFYHNLIAEISPVYNA